MLLGQPPGLQAAGLIPAVPHLILLLSGKRTEAMDFRNSFVIAYAI